MLSTKPGKPRLPLIQPMSPQNTNAALARIEALIGQGHLQQAESSCHELLKHAPREPKAWACLGLIALWGERLADAESAMRQATALDRYNGSYWSNLAVAVFGQGRWKESEEQF